MSSVYINISFSPFLKSVRLTMGKKDFLLIFSMDPAAADVIREDFLVSLDGNQCVFQWECKKGKFENVCGTILQRGRRH